MFCVLASSSVKHSLCDILPVINSFDGKLYSLSRELNTVL